MKLSKFVSSTVLFPVGIIAIALAGCASHRGAPIPVSKARQNLVVASVPASQRPPQIYTFTGALKIARELAANDHNLSIRRVDGVLTASSYFGHAAVMLIRNFPRRADAVSDAVAIRAQLKIGDAVVFRRPWGRDEYLNIIVGFTEDGIIGRGASQRQTEIILAGSITGVVSRSFSYKPSSVTADADTAAPRIKFDVPRVPLARSLNGGHVAEYPLRIVSALVQSPDGIASLNIVPGGAGRYALSIPRNSVVTLLSQADPTNFPVETKIHWAECMSGKTAQFDVYDATMPQGGSAMVLMVAYQ